MKQLTHSCRTPKPAPHRARLHSRTCTWSRFPRLCRRHGVPNARTSGFDLVLISLWTDSQEDQRHVDWTREFFAALQPWSAGSVYVNTLDQDDVSRVPEAYGANYARLSTVKAIYDPQNRFRCNNNIQPAT